MDEGVISVINGKKKKRAILCLWKKWLVFALSMTLVVGFYLVAVKQIKVHKDLGNLTADDFSVVFQIDAVRNKGNSLSLEGWAFILDKDAVKEDVELWLYDMEDEKIVYPKTIEYTQRKDVNNYFLCEFDYSNCGIMTSFDTEKINVEDKDYQILISDMCNFKVYQTDTYLSKGELVYCLPDEYVELDVEGTDLEGIVNDGVLRVYRPDFGMYVYQYEGELYWIAEPDYGFVNEDTYVQFQMFTTQIENLPADRLANNAFWSNIGFRFKSKELVEENTGKYRVTKCALPVEYSITRISTGNYIDTWIWKQIFRPWYEFSENE